MSKYLIRVKGWIGVDAIQEGSSAAEAGETWARKQASLTPGEITIYPLGEPERFTVKIEQVSVKPTAQPGTVAAAMDKAHEEVKRGGGGVFSEFVKGSMPTTDPPGVVRTRHSTGPAAAREWKNPNVKSGQLAAAVGAAHEEFVKAVAGACTCDAWFAPPEARRKHSEGCPAAAPVAPLDSASGDSPSAT